VGDPGSSDGNPSMTGDKRQNSGEKIKLQIKDKTSSPTGSG
jgi:hypothetical protein